MSRSVWTYIIGKYAGPHRMSIQLDSDGYDDIRAEQIVLPQRVGVDKTTVDIKGRHYSVYFNMAHHLQDHTNVTYVFIRMANQYKAINLCPEDTLPDLTCILQMFVFMFFS